jgi:hypothetical protein
MPPQLPSAPYAWHDAAFALSSVEVKVAAASLPAATAIVAAPAQQYTAICCVVLKPALQYWVGSQRPVGTDESTCECLNTLLGLTCGFGLMQQGGAAVLAAAAVLQARCVAPCSMPVLLSSGSSPGQAVL